MNDKKNSIKIAFFLNAGFALLELVGGILVNSISVLSDAVHDFGDALSIAFSWILDKKSTQKANDKYTYGYLRFSVLGALINTVILSIGCIVMLSNAIPRIINPEQVNHGGMMLLAVLGIAVNSIAAYKTAKGQSISEKVVSLHLIEDILGWASVLICSVLMKLFNLPILDPILSILISLFILFNVFKNMKKIFEVFLQKAPSDVDVDKIIENIKKQDEKILDVHHVHLWSIDGVNNYASVHLLLSDEIVIQNIPEFKEICRNEFMKNGVKHVTIETELKSENCNDKYCNMRNVQRKDSNHGHYH